MLNIPFASSPRLGRMQNIMVTMRLYIMGLGQMTIVISARSTTVVVTVRFAMNVNVQTRGATKSMRVNLPQLSGCCVG